MNATESILADTSLRIEPNRRRIRGMWHGRTVIDTTASLLVWEHPYYPAWYIPLDDLRGDLVVNGETFASSRRG